MQQDIWQQLCNAAAAQYNPQQVTPFLYAHHVVCALQAADGQIFTGFCIESCCGVMDLCAERVAALNMYVNSGQTQVQRLVVFRDQPPAGGITGMPCGACREFFLQLSPQNRHMQILTNLATRQTTTLGQLMPHWWGEERYLQSNI